MFEAQANSISGTYSTLHSEAQFAASLPSHPSLPSSVTSPSLQLAFYLPPSFHLEDITISSSSESEKLHSAIAMVTTAERSYYVLKMTGQILGSEEEGVGEIWQKMVGCKRDGSKM